MRTATTLALHLLALAALVWGVVQSSTFESFL